MIQPEGTSLSFEIKPDADWIPMEPNGDTNHPLYGLPASVDARMVLQGTTELMPGIYVDSSYVTPSRPRTDLVHITTEQTTPVAVTEVQVISTLEWFDDTPHDIAVSILTGALFDTETAASSSSDVVLPDGSTRRIWTFTGLASITAFKLKTSATTTTALSVFHVAESTYVAYP